MRLSSGYLHRGSAARIGALAALLLVVGFLYLVPLLWMGVVSIKPADQAAAPGVGLLPNVESPDHPGERLSYVEPDYWAGAGKQAARNYRDVWDSPVADFPLYFKNSTIIATLSVLGMVVSSAVVAYGFARLKWPGRDGVFVLVLATLMIPPAVLMAPQYVLFKQLGWIGTFRPLWVLAWFGGAFSIFLLRQFFLTIPRELDEAARIDGCSHLGVFLRVILPMAKPALAIVALIQFASSWNDFQGPLLFLNHQDQYTLALGLQSYHQQHGGTPWNLVMAASCLVVFPVLVLYVVARRFFVESDASRGIKE
jgi:multiple sugar transport system permease protein